MTRILLLLGLVACKDADPAPGSGSGSAVPVAVAVAADAAPAVVRTGPGPQLAPVVDAGPEPDAPSIADEFSEQSRDPGWAPRVERELEQRIKLPAKTRTIECRSSRCKITLSVADDAAALDASAAVETALRGYATQMIVDSPGVVYAVFDR